MILPPRKDDSCVLWFDFASVKNNTVYDQSKYHNDGTIYGATHIGRFGLHGLHFDGVDDYVNCGNISFGTGDFTAIVFLRFPLLGERFARIIDKNVNSCNGFSLLKDADNAYGFQFLMYYDDNGTIYSNPRLIVKNISEGNHLIAGVRNGYDCKAYLDGVLKAQETTQFITDISSSDPVTISGTTGYLNSNIYFVALYNRALSDAEIRELYYYLTKGIRSIVPSRFVARAMG